MNLWRMATHEMGHQGGTRARRRTRRSWLLAVLAGLSAGCGSSTIEPDPAVAPFVGTWDATAFTVTSDTDPSIVIDVLVEIGPFYISVEPSGQYTATLESAFQPIIEIGQLTVIGGTTLRLDPSIPADAPTATSLFVFTADDYVVLDGPTEFDFNGDFVADEPAQAHIELQRR